MKIYRKYVFYQCRRVMTHQDVDINNGIYRDYSVVTLHPGRNRIYPLGLGTNNVPGSRFPSQSCHNVISTRVRPFFCVVTPLFSDVSFTFLFPRK